MLHLPAPGGETDRSSTGHELPEGWFGGSEISRLMRPLPHLDVGGERHKGPADRGGLLRRLRSYHYVSRPHDDPDRLSSATDGQGSLKGISLIGEK